MSQNKTKQNKTVFRKIDGKPHLASVFSNPWYIWLNTTQLLKNYNNQVDPHVLGQKDIYKDSYKS